MNRSTLYIILSITLFLFIVWICTQTHSPVNWEPPFYNVVNNKQPEVYITYDVNKHV